MTPPLTPYTTFSVALNATTGLYSVNFDGVPQPCAQDSDCAGPLVCAVGQWWQQPLANATGMCTCSVIVGGWYGPQCTEWTSSFAVGQGITMVALSLETMLLVALTFVWWRYWRALMRRSNVAPAIVSTGLSPTQRRSCVGQLAWNVWSIKPWSVALVFVTVDCLCGIPAYATALYSNIENPWQYTYLESANATPIKQQRLYLAVAALLGIYLLCSLTSTAWIAAVWFDVVLRSRRLASRSSKWLRHVPHVVTLLNLCCFLPITITPYANQSIVFLLIAIEALLIGGAYLAAFFALAKLLRRAYQQRAVADGTAASATYPNSGELGLLQLSAATHAAVALGVASLAVFVLGVVAGDGESRSTTYIPPDVAYYAARELCYRAMFLGLSAINVVLLWQVWVMSPADVRRSGAHAESLASSRNKAARARDGQAGDRTASSGTAARRAQVAVVGTTPAVSASA